MPYPRKEKPRHRQKREKSRKGRDAGSMRKRSFKTRAALRGDEFNSSVPADFLDSSAPANLLDSSAPANFLNVGAHRRPSRDEMLDPCRKRRQDTSSVEGR